MCIWVFCASSLGALTFVVACTFGVIQGLPTLLITTFLFFVLLFVLGVIGDALGGITSIPSAQPPFYVVSVGGAESLVTAVIPFPAQAHISIRNHLDSIGNEDSEYQTLINKNGAEGGALGIMEFMPVQYKHMLDGPSLKVDLHTGTIAEGVLTFTITFDVLYIVLRGPSNLLVKNWLHAMSTVTLVVAGSSYTGPSMNPTNVSSPLILFCF
ncbi:aquaporin SIP1-1-like [Olea europaea subsp. europaea]|uniref:Aquaporin SIP1-1-like n=1 Tax=Olea europaea subsp. europaea TaxID=158383 RepID=A0A8S0UVW9_OLEEU|nr:aquaporin SIP1-1-like [Olea europaea subsp. europaea]